MGIEETPSQYRLTLSGLPNECILKILQKCHCGKQVVMLAATDSSMHSVTMNMPAWLLEQPLRTTIDNHIRALLPVRTSASLDATAEFLIDPACMHFILTALGTMASVSRLFVDLKHLGTIPSPVSHATCIICRQPCVAGHAKLHWLLKVPCHQRCCMMAKRWRNSSKSPVPRTWSVPGAAADRRQLPPRHQNIMYVHYGMKVTRDDNSDSVESLLCHSRARCVCAHVRYPREYPLYKTFQPD